MRNPILLIFLVLISVVSCAQETFTLSGGVIIASPIDYSGYFNENYHSNADGFRFAATYEAGPLESKKFIHGVTAGYMLSSTTVTVNKEDVDISVRTLPFCYAPKYLIGTEKLMAFARAQVGMQFTRLKVSGPVDESDNDFGFYGGIGAGGMAYLSQKVFINLEYEIAFMSNTFYANGYINSVQAGIGIDF